MKIILLAIVSLALSCAAYQDEVHCESTYYQYWEQFPDQPNLRTCRMDMTTKIDAYGFLIASRDESVKGIWFKENKKIEFFPENMGAMFPNAIGVNAWQCAILTISREHFRDFNQLRALLLSDNKIEEIASNTFMDLTTLETLTIRNNRLKFVNGIAFQNLINLKLVSMAGNDCINENFESPGRLNELAEIVSTRCRYREAADVQDAKRLQMKVNELLNEISKLQLQLEDVMNKKCNDESNFDLMKEELKKIDEDERYLKNEKTWNLLE